MLEWLRDIVQPIFAKDEDFGDARYLRQSKTWECIAPFSPVGGPVEVLIHGTQEGPTRAQRKKWLDLAQHYPALLPQAASAIEQAVAQLKLPSLTMQLAAVTIPEDSVTDHDLELTFGHPSGPPQFDVRISSWQVRELIGPL